MHNEELLRYVPHAVVARKRAANSPFTSSQVYAPRPFHLAAPLLTNNRPSKENPSRKKSLDDTFRETMMHFERKARQASEKAFINAESEVSSSPLSTVGDNEGKTSSQDDMAMQSWIKQYHNQTIRRDQRQKRDELDNPFADELLVETPTRLRQNAEAEENIYEYQASRVHGFDELSILQTDWSNHSLLSDKDDNTADELLLNLFASSISPDI